MKVSGGGDPPSYPAPSASIHDTLSAQRELWAPESVSLAKVETIPGGGHRIYLAGSPGEEGPYLADRIRAVLRRAGHGGAVEVCSGGDMSGAAQSAASFADFWTPAERAERARTTLSKYVGATSTPADIGARFPRLVKVRVSKLGSARRDQVGVLRQTPIQGRPLVVELPGGAHEYVTTAVQSMLYDPSTSTLFLRTGNSRYAIWRV